MAPVIRAILIPVGQAPRPIELPEPGLYREIATVLGGPLERLVSFALDPAGRMADCWCNEDGLRLELRPNRIVRLPRFRAAVMGPVVITASDEADGQAYSLTDRELALVAHIVDRWPPVLP